MGKVDTDAMNKLKILDWDCNSFNMVNYTGLIYSENYIPCILVKYTHKRPATVKEIIWIAKLFKEL